MPAFNLAPNRPADIVARRHSRKKSSQILVEPSGLPANYVPRSPTLAVPHGLESILLHPPAEPSPTHHSLPQLVVPTPRNPARTNSLHGHSRAASMHLDFGRSKSLHSHKFPPLPDYAPGDSVKKGRNRASSFSDAATAGEDDVAAVSSGVSLRSGESGGVAKPTTNTKPITNTEPTTTTNPTTPTTTTSTKTKPTTPIPDNNDTTPTPLSAASSLIAGQLVSKLFTFFLNQAILRLVGPAIFGSASQLDLLTNTILVFAREPARLATQRQSIAAARPDVYRFGGGPVAGTVSGTCQQVINFGFVSLVLGFPLAVLLGGFYYNFSSSSPSSIAISLAAAIIELAAEPAFLLFQLNLKFAQRATFESLAVGARCIVTFFGVLFSKNLLAAFAIGQLAYAITLTSLYFYFAKSIAPAAQYDVRKPSPVWHQDSAREVPAYLHPDTRALARSLWLQSIFKHCLSEGDKFLVSLLLPIADQGVYAVVSNYGSLAARLVFFPVEETLRNIFSKLLPKDPRAAVALLSTVLRAYLYLALFVAIFAPGTTPYLLRFLVSSSWLRRTTPSVFTAYAAYVPFLAVNGALEAFVQSAASPAQIRSQSRVLCLFSASFAAAAYTLMRPAALGATGLVLANMLNMAQRIVWALVWVATNTVPPQRFAWLRDAVPAPAVLVPAAAAAAIAWRAVGTVHTVRALVQLVALAVALLACVCVAERKWVRTGVAMVFGEKTR